MLPGTKCCGARLALNRADKGLHMTRFAKPHLLFPLLALLAVSACETFEGLGRDVETTGAVISEEAREAQ